MIAAVPQTGAGGYLILFLAVAASWIGIPLVGAGVLATAGVLASEGELNLWWVILVATAGAWIGGYVGYLLGRTAGDAVANRPGLWQHHRRRTMRAGQQVYRRWGRIAVFVTPTSLSGALKMPTRTFLAWNALAALASTSIAAVGAYGIGAAVLGRLSARNGVRALVVVALVSASATLFLAHRRRRRT
jgi:membrane protein DedA with SNARE-associated domain